MQATLSHYRILEQIGAGGMGVVYRARDEHLRRDVALKVLPPGTVAKAARQRFQKEALTLSRLNHPNIATVHDFDTQDGMDFLVEEFIDGLSLDAMLASGPLSEKEIIHLGSQLAAGLSAAHEQGIIHRDLKPANLRVTPDARLKILDFGLAVMLRGESSPTAVTESMSKTEGVVGTLPYMAPEQLLGGRVDHRVDIWSMGCVLYEMATGRRPFLGSGPALTESILHETAPDVTKLNPKIDSRIGAVIQNCLEKDPGKRYVSARAVGLDLERMISGAAREPVRRTRVGKWAAGVGFAGLLMLLLVLKASKAVRQSFFSDQARPVAQATAPHEAYLSGLQYLERWDKAGNVEAAIGLFEQAVRADPAFALGFSALAEAHWAKYRLDRDPRWIDEAERDCRKAAELSDQLPAVYVTLSRVHNGRGQLNLALEEAQRALKLEPLNSDALMAAAAVYAAMGQLEKAESTYKKAAVLRPNHWSGFYELGAFYYQQKRDADATTEFQEALKIAPDNAMAEAALGGVMERLGSGAEAEKHLKRSLELQPSYAGYTNLGVWYYQHRRWDESVAMTRKALAINATDWRAWSNLGLAYEWLNNRTAADEAFRSELARLEGIARASGDDADLQVELGLLHSRWKRREKAEPLLEAALARAPEDPGVLARAGEGYNNLQERDRALDLVKKALEHGWTLAQLENDPGQRELIRDPRFGEIARTYKNNYKPSQQ